MNTTATFLTVDELYALDRLLIDARYTAAVDRRAGRTRYADDADDMVTIVQGLVDRHRAATRGTPP